MRSELAGTAVGGVPQDEARRDTVSHGPVNHLQRQLGFRFEGDVGGDAGLAAASRVVGPALGQIQLEVEGQVLGPSGDTEADAHLAVGHFARRAGGLPLHPHRMLVLLEEAGVVHNPHLHRLASSHLLQRVLHRHPPHLPVAPLRVHGEVQQPLVHGIHPSGVRACASGDGFDALSFPVSQQAHGIEGERATPALLAKHVADSLEVPLKSLHGSGIHERVHTYFMSRTPRGQRNGSQEQAALSRSLPRTPLTQ